MVPVDKVVSNSYFKNPALLAEIEKDSPFYIEFSAYADKDFLGFVGNPAYAFQDAAKALKSFLSSQSDEYIDSNYDEIASIFSFDPQFPTKGATSSESAYFVKEYLENRFEEIGAGNRARAAINAANSDLAIYGDNPTSVMRGELDFSLKLGGGSVKNGFGWNAGMAIVFDGAESILYKSSSNDRKNINDFYLSVFSDLGYGTYLGSENVAIGFSFSPSFLFRTGISNSDFLTARSNGNFINLVMNNSFDFGLGLQINLGLMLKPTDEIRLLINLRNLPTMQIYWYFTATDVVSDFQFHEDENIYFTPPDASIGLLWDKGKYHVTAEISNIADQMIWAALVPSYDFDILSVPKVSFAYDLSDAMSIGAGYRYRSIFVEYEWAGLRAELNAKLDRLGFGFLIGYEI